MFRIRHNDVRVEMWRKHETVYKDLYLNIILNIWDTSENRLIAFM